MAKTYEKKAQPIQPVDVADMAPREEDVERTILGTILEGQYGSFEDIRLLTEEDFYSDDNRAIFKAMVQVDADGEFVEYLTVASRIERLQLQSCFEENDHIAYLRHLIQYDAPIGQDLDSLAKVLRNVAICRHMFLSIWAINDAAFHKRGEEAQLLIEALAAQVRARSHDRDLTPVGDLVSGYMERLDMLHQHRGQIVGVPSGLADLDRLTGGFQDSDLIILAGRPAMGKTAAALSMAHDMAIKFKKNVVIFELEMSKEQLIQRFLSMDAGIDQTKLRSGWIEDDEWERIAESMATLTDATIWIDDTPGISVQEIRGKVNRLIASGVKPDAIFVDYLQLMSVPGSSGKAENRVQEVSAISRDLKGLAREFDLPVIALAQLSRAVEQRQSKIPQLSDLRESGSIEQDSDVVMFIYRDDVYNPDTDRPNIADIIVAKHRNGPVGEVSTYFKKNETRFRDLEVSPSADEMSSVDGSLARAEEEEFRY